MCAITGGLCNGCQRKLEKGEITPADVALSSALYKMAPRFAIGEVEVVRCFDAGNIAYVLANGEVSSLIGRGGRVAGELAKQLGKHVRIIRAGQEPAALAAEILLPAKPSGMNTVYHDGREAVKVRLPRGQAMRLPARVDALKTVFSSVFGKPVQIAFE